MSKYRFKHTGKAKLRVKTGADAEISNQQYDLATLLAEVGVKRNQLSNKSLRLQRLNVVAAIDIATRVPLGLTLVQGEQKPPLNELLGSPS
ncbi:hypothetical protein [Sulfitobacter sp. R18_1]|uniref:hypothetical protein n=1 Tax=Sulfitobacter sp. R18_1 TaxID=2821104 RepID=UPI001AD99799|nr:hypothetical protein [Sulfitobacter sp. R18_1]MBO9429655.1 hypothetical protein [Sulfitobacter sp. R18_1]